MIKSVITIAALWLVAQAAQAAALPTGAGKIALDVQGIPIEVYTYKPAHYSGGPLLLTLHGVARNAPGYRDYSKPLADRHGLLVAAPLFDRKRFPRWRYQTGGLVHRSNQDTDAQMQVEPEPQWTGRLLLGIIEAIRTEERSPALPYYMLGHSGGAQALSRFAAFVPNEALRIVIANPGTHLWPGRELRFPYGYGGLPTALSRDESIRRYLAQPITLLLGTADVQQDGDLDMEDGAIAQGAHRFERGVNTYRAAEAEARARGWAFNWKLVEVPGVGHSASRMLRSPQAAAALAPAP